MCLRFKIIAFRNAFVVVAAFIARFVVLFVVFFRAEEYDEQDDEPGDKSGYNDESIAESDYFKTEAHDERGTTFKRDENARAAAENAAESGQAGQTAATDENAENVRKPLNENGDEYYRSVKDEIDELFKTHEKDDTLKEAFPCSEWVKIKEPDKAEYLVGVIYEEAAPLYICYAFPAADKDDPPEDIAETCAFVPLSPFIGAKGCFVIFQSTATGECVKLKEA